MGNVGLNFGSATSGAGFDVTATVNQIVGNLQMVEAPWKAQVTKLTSEDTQLTSLGSQLSTLTTDLQNLTDFSGVLASKQGSSSDTGVVSLTSAATTATAGTHTMSVQNLAQTSTAASSVVAATDTLAGSVIIQGHMVSIGDSASPATLAGLASAINSAAIGVMATVLTDTTGTRLSLVSSTSGAAGSLTVSSTLTNSSAAGSPVSLKQIQAGIDANMTIDGVALTSASNTVTNAIPGVTFQLLSSPIPSENVQIIIANDTSSVSTAVNTFVTDYNTVMKAINKQEGKDASGNAEPLYATSVLAQLQESLQSGLSAAFGTNAVNSTYSLGITANQDGTISLNSDTLTSVLNTNYSDVSAFFQNTGSFGATFANVLNQLGSGNMNGAISLALSENKSQETTFNNDVSNEEALIAIQKTSLTAELNFANQILQSIPSEINQINEMYSAITGYSKTSG